MALFSSKMNIRANGLSLLTTPQRQKRQRYPSRHKPNIQLLNVTTVICVCIAASLIPQCQGFFFPKSFFRKGNDSPPPPPPQQHPRVLGGGTGGSIQNNYRGEHLQGAGTDVQPALRIVNRPHPPPRNIDQTQQASGPVPGSGFHVPKELCLACERFPWMPVAGGERPAVGAASTSISHSQQPPQQQQFFSASAQGSAPTKTIVINALGEAQGPIPQLPSLPSPGRRPFAIQFDGNQSGNKVNYQNAPKQQPPPPPPSSPPEPINQQNNFSQAKPEKPVTFQIYQAEGPRQQATLLQQSSHPIGLQPPPISQSGAQSTYGRPTVLIPVNTQSTQVGANVNVQGNQAPPPNPLAVGTIIAAQQNNAQLPQFQKIEPAKLVYQEHFTAQGSSSPPSPQNFKVPIIPHPTQGSGGKTPTDHATTNNIAPQPYPTPQNFGPPQPQENYRPGGIFLQMRPPAPYPMQPPRPSPNMKPPGPVIHYGKPIRIPTNIGPQRPSGQVIFPPPQAYLQMGPPPPPQGQPPNPGYGAPRPDSLNAIDSAVRPQDERRPSPSGQVLNIQLPQQHQQQQQQQQYNRPQNQGQVLNSNTIQPVPIPIPTTLQSHQESGKNNKLEPTFTQETGWEIIPSIQTDLTHLFAPEKGKPSLQGSKELPVPVPIPVPQSHPPKSPFFIVAGAGQQEEQHQEQQIKVQDVTYHEESRNPVPSGSIQTNAIRDGERLQQQQQHTDQQQQQQHSSLHTNSLVINENQQSVQQDPSLQAQQISHQVIRPRPFILGVPTGPTRPVIFRPISPQQPYQQLHPSIMTALNHAQQTSLLTHQYFRQPNVGQQIRDNTIYVSPVVGSAPSAAPNAQQIQQLQGNNALLSESTSNSVQQETHEANNLEQQQQQQQQQYVVNQGIDPRIPTATSAHNVDQSNPNCQGAQQQQQPWLIPITTHQKLQKQQQAEAQQLSEHSQESGHVAHSMDQSNSSSDNLNPEKDDQSQSIVGSGRDNTDDDDASSSPDSLSPEPTFTTSLASAPPTTATTSVTNVVGSTASASSTQGFRGSVSVQDNGNKGSYLIYYQRPVSKSPVYWVQPSRTTSQGVVRLSPQITPVSPSVSSVVSWSRPRVVVANQFLTEHQQRYEDPKTEEARSQESFERGEETDGSEEQAQSEQDSSEHSNDDDENIPFGQKLGVSRDSNKIQTPYDIISVGGSDDEAQSLEETAGSSDHSQGLESIESTGKDQYGESDFSTSGQDGSSAIGNDQIETNSGPSREYPEEGRDQSVLQNENNLQSVQQEAQNSQHSDNEDADDERDDFGFRPQTIFRKPISTTVIHSPGASSFQSLKLPNFKPHRVIVHDFTAHSANAAATGPSASASEPQESFEISKDKPSDSLSNAWIASQKLKSPKLVENNDDEEESSESIQRPQGFNIQEVIASGPVSNADCLTTAHSGHLLASLSSTSPRTPESLVTSATSAKGRDIFLPIGSRFPGGRPSIFSAIHRPLSPVPTTTTTTSPTTTPTSTSENVQEAFNPSNNKRERYLGQSPSGFAASIPVPVYRRPISINHVSRESFDREESNVGGSGSNTIHGESVTYIKPQSNVILTAEDIYKTSEMKEERVSDNVSNIDPIRVVESSTSVSSSVDSEALDSQDEIMSTEKSSSFSVSVVDEKIGGFTSNKDERDGSSSPTSLGNNDISQQVGAKPLSKVNVVQVTSVPVISDAEPITTTASTLTPSPLSIDSITSTTAIPSPASTSTKIVKTVRVRQRMRSGSFNGPLRTRFHGGGRVRVVHRPANQEYIRHFPEFATHDGDKLAKEEEQEVKNALIELKKSTEPIKTH